MFRPIRRTKRAISIDMAKDLLAHARRGILAMNGVEGYPYAVPINYIYVEEDNKIYFHGARAGHKLEAIKACDKVCFTAYGNETIKKEAWAPYVQSVVVFGKCHIIEDQEYAKKLVKTMAMKYYPEESIADEEIKSSGDGMYMFEIEIEHMSGKEIQEK